MAITYKSQGAGASTETSGAALSPACPATVDAGDILIGHVFWEGTTTAPSTPTDWTLLSGPHVIESTIARHWVFGKVADGTEDGASIAFGSPAVTTQRGARIYSFAGRVGGAIDQLCLGFSHQSHATDPQMPTVTTLSTGALAIALVGQNDNNAQASATGESGGDWTEAVAAFTAVLTPGLALQIQTCTPTSNPGTVSGGSSATQNDPVGVIGFQIWDEPRYADPLRAGLTEAAAVTMIGLFASDTVSLGLTDHDIVNFEYALLDSVSVGLTDTASVDTGETLVEKTASDTLPVGLTEQAGILTAQPASDSLTIGLSESSIVVAAQASTDSLALGLTEQTTVFGLPGASDSIPLGLVETATQFVTDATSDTLPIGLADTAVIVSVQSVSDALPIGLTESANTAVAIATSDSLVLGLSDPDITNFEYTVLDSLRVGLTETATPEIQGEGVIEITASDALPIGLTESAVIAIESSASDSLIVGLLENAAASVALQSSDSMELVLTESTTFGTVGVASSDLLSVGVTEAVVIGVVQSVSDILSFGLNDLPLITTTVSTDDLLRAGLSDTATTPIVAVSSFDTIAAWLNDPDIVRFEYGLTDALLVALSEIASVTVGNVVSISTSDLVAIRLSEVATVVDLSGGVTFVSTADTLRAGLTETASVQVLVVASDSLTVVVDEPYTSQQEVVTADAIALGLSEVATVVDLSGGFVEQTSFDQLTVGIVDSAVVQKAQTEADSIVLGVTEQATVSIDEQITKVAQDLLTVGLTESAAVARAETLSDDVPLGLSESAVVHNALPATSDSVSVGLFESANIVDLTGGQSFLTDDDGLALHLTEDILVASAGVASDEFVVGITEQANVSVVIVASDVIGMGMDEAFQSLFVSVSSDDVLPSGLTEDVLMAVSSSAQDGVGFVLNEVIAAVQTLLSVSDQVRVSVLDASEVIDEGGTVQKASSDLLSIGLTENGVLHTVLVNEQDLVVASVEYLGLKTVESLGLPHSADVVDLPYEAELWLN